MFFTLFWSRVSPWPGTFPHPICLANHWAASAQHHALISHVGSHTVNIKSDSGPCVWEASTLLTEPSFRSLLRISLSLGACIDWESAFAESNVGFRCASRLDSVRCFFCFFFLCKKTGSCWTQSLQEQANVRVGLDLPSAASLSHGVCKNLYS